MASYPAPPALEDKAAPKRHTEHLQALTALRQDPELNIAAAEGKPDDSPPILGKVNWDFPNRGRALGLLIAELAVGKVSPRRIQDYHLQVPPSGMQRFIFAYRHHIRGVPWPPIQLVELFVYMRDDPRVIKSGIQGTMYRHLGKLTRATRPPILSRLAPLMSGIMPPNDGKYAPGNNNRG